MSDLVRNPLRPAAGPAVSNGLCFAAMAFWAAAFPAAEILLETWGVIALIAARMGFGALVLAIVWRLVEGAAAIRRAAWSKGLFIGGLGFGVGATLLLAGQAYSDPVTTAIIASMTPIAGAAVEYLYDRKRLSARLLAGIALALIGGLIAAGADLARGTVGLGALLSMVSVFVYVWGTRAANVSLPGETVLGRTAVTSIGAAAVCLSAWATARVMGWETAAVGAMGASELALFVTYALLAFCVSQFLWLWSAGSLGVLVASLHMNAVPFYVMIAGVIGLGADWSWAQALGAAIVAAGVLLAQARPTQRRI